jgi:hypothetical protein
MRPFRKSAVRRSLTHTQLVLMPIGYKAGYSASGIGRRVSSTLRAPSPPSLLPVLPRIPAAYKPFLLLSRGNVTSHFAAAALPGLVDTRHHDSILHIVCYISRERERAALFRLGDTLRHRAACMLQGGFAALLSMYPSKPSLGATTSLFAAAAFLGSSTRFAIKILHFIRPAAS